jgi:hypothetical protein
VSIIISKISGWEKLAQSYNGNPPVSVKRFLFQDGWMRYGINYRGILTLGGNYQGFTLSIIFLFLIGHPPLFIPWNEIVISEKQQDIFSKVKLQFPRHPDIYLTLTRQFAEKLSQTSNNRFRLY